MPLPAARGGRWRIVALLVLDVALLVIGGALILSYLDARDAAADKGAPVAPPSASGKAEARPATPDPAARTARSSQLEALVGARVEERREDIQRCHGEASGSGQQVAGRLDIALTIDADGNVVSAEPVVDETGSAGLAGCVIELFQRWSFPGAPGAGAVELVWPLRFQAAK